MYIFIYVCVLKCFVDYLYLYKQAVKTRTDL